MTALDTVVDELLSAVRSVDVGDLERAAAVIRESDGAITFTGQGRSGLIGAMTAMRLMHLGFRAHSAGESTAPSVRAGDVLVAISGSGTTHTTEHFARIAASEGAKVIAVLRDADSPIGALADVVVEIPAEKQSQVGGTRFEHTALVALDAVVHLLAESVPDAKSVLRRNHTNLQ
ncbi:SIS domain-containing protein [Microbacterium sp. NPDC058389]|uniref:SIS domain-containing protein n=1 Tax=Microbacterium sp. NPDC058389 TaxID=3346475 RepID=UPI00364DFCB7